MTAELAELRIEPLAISDLLEVAAIERQSFAHPWSLAAFVHELRQGRARRFVARVTGQRSVVGYAVVWVAGDEAQLNNLAVRPAQRLRGVARKLLAAAIEASSTAAATSLWLEVRPSNSAARRLYASAGFCAAGRRRGYYVDGEDALILRRPIQPASRQEGSSR